MNNMKQLSMQLNTVAENIAYYLALKQKENGFFPARDFYGKSFSALLWNMFGDRFQNNVDRAVNAIRNEPKIHKGYGKYHFEFNRYALAKMGMSEVKLNDFLQGERYAETRVANWTLLRSYCRLASGSAFSRILGQIELQAVLMWFRTKDGLIEDEKGSFTSQYHAFCASQLV